MSGRSTQSLARAVTTVNPQQSSLALSPIAALIRTSIIGIGLGLVNSTSNAATITVNSNLDDGINCTLRGAIESINTGMLSFGCPQSSVTGVFGVDDAIDFNMPSNTITLNGTQLEVVNSNVTINGDNDNIDINGDNGSRVLFLDNSTVTLNNLTIRNGYTTNITDGDSGGGIYAKGGNTTITNSTITLNYAYAKGGGIFSTDGAVLSISDSEILRNSVYGVFGSPGGSAVHVSGVNSVVNIYDSLLSDNLVSGGGAAIFAEDSATVNLKNSTLTKSFFNELISGTAITASSGAFIDITNSTVSDTVMYGDAMAISASGSSTSISLTNSSVLRVSADFGTTTGVAASAGASISLINSTVSGSRGYSGSYGVTASNGASIGLLNSTVSRNSTYINNATGVATIGSGASITLSNSTVTDTYAYSYTYNYGHLTNSVITNVSNSPGSNITILNSILNDAKLIGAPTGSTSLSYDCYGLVSVDTTSIISDGSCGATISGDPDLGPLADNGGPTLTHALNAGSIAINTANNAICPAKDQRGELRDDNACDVGAYEFQTQNSTVLYVVPISNGNTVIIPL